MPRGLVTLVVALMVLAITVQNTCPYGYAGKTAAAAPHAHNCPLKNHQPSTPESPDRVDTGLGNLGNAYVFTAADIGCFLEFLGPAEPLEATATYGHEDALSSPPLRPPRPASPLNT